MKKLGVQPQAWAPFAEGLKGMFAEPVLMEIAEKHGKTVPQVILRWDIEQGIIIIPKSTHKNRMEENMGIWDFELDCSKPSEIDRLYAYLNNPVLTSL